MSHAVPPFDSVQVYLFCADAEFERHHIRVFFKQKTAYEIASCLVGSEMCIRDRTTSPTQIEWPFTVLEKKPNVVAFKLGISAK